MKPCLLIVLFFFRSILPVSAQETGPAARLQKALNQDVADGQFVGAVVAYSVGEEEVIVAAGSRDVEAKLPFETSTLNRIASIAKPMTAVAALQLFEQGKLDLDEPIATYLPSYPAQHASHISTRQLLPVSLKRLRSFRTETWSTNQAMQSITPPMAMSSLGWSLRPCLVSPMKST